MAQQILHRAIITGDSEAWNPANMDDLLFFLHAPWEGGNHPASLADRAQNPGLAAGDPVETATDWSPAGNHFTQPTLSFRPTWEAGILGGASHAFDFDGSDDRWTAAITSDEELYFVSVLLRGPADPRFLFHWGTPLNFSTLHCLAQTSNTSIVGMRGDSGSSYGANGAWAITGGVERLNWHSHLTPSELVCTLNDVDVIASTTGSPIAIASKSQSFDLGSRNGAFAWDGAVGTAIAFSQKPSAGAIAQLNTWLDEAYA